ncbi:hypothetical protein QQ73_01820, partial [Candidatus Endoriftia persephone str. Guaymas]|nr:hypothetical protein [Candidatus Endoriftia persephone str. Guaymas]
LILNAEPEKLLLAAGEKRTLRYPLQAGDRFGLAQIHLAVEGEQIISLFNGPVSLNAQGEAQIELQLPDFNGTLRLMAVAFGEDR